MRMPALNARAALPAAFALLAVAFALTGISESVHVVQNVADWHAGDYGTQASPPWLVQALLGLDGLLVTAGLGTLLVLAATRNLDAGMRRAVAICGILWVAMMAWGFAMRGAGVHGPAMPVQVLLAAALAVTLAWPRAQPRWLLVLGGVTLALRGPALSYASHVQLETLRAGEAWGEMLAWRILPPTVGALGAILLALAYATAATDGDARPASETAAGAGATAQRTL